LEEEEGNESGEGTVLGEDDADNLNEDSTKDLGNTW